MARRKQTRGKCIYCGREMTRSGLIKHLKACPERSQAQAEVESNKERPQPLYHLLVQDAWHGDFWLHLEMRGNATLEDLDYYLRQIWLECCGHLSAFQMGDTRYTQLFDDGMQIGIEKAMDVKVHRLFRPGMSIPYEYDFGSTTGLVIRVVDERRGKPTTSHPIALMARNELQPVSCIECDQPATHICLECMYEDRPCELCDEHAEIHPHRDYGDPMPLLNSPRTGVCGYEGPAEPPY